MVDQRRRCKASALKHLSDPCFLHPGKRSFASVASTVEGCRGEVAVHRRAVVNPGIFAMIACIWRSSEMPWKS